MGAKRCERFPVVGKRRWDSADGVHRFRTSTSQSSAVVSKGSTSTRTRRQNTAVPLPAKRMRLALRGWRESPDGYGAVICDFKRKWGGF